MNENWVLYAVQIFSFAACIVSAMGKNKKNILKWTGIANTSNFLVMLLAGATDGWANSLSTTIRGILFAFRHKWKGNVVFYFCIGLHLVAFLLSYQDLWSFFLLAATLLVCISQWFGNPLQIKIYGILSILCWIVYTLHIGLYLDLPKRIIEGVFLIIAATKLVKEKKQNENKSRA